MLDFGIMIVVDFLKWLGQYPISIYVLAIAMIFSKHFLFLMILLRCFYNSLSRPGTDELLHLTMVLVNSSSKNKGHKEGWYELSLFKILSSTLWNWAVLNEEWRACHKSPNSKQGWLLYLIASMAGRLRLLTQFINS